MAKQSYLDRKAMLENSSIIENAPCVIDGDPNNNYTNLYSLKCSSSQSQSCAGPRTGIEKKV